MFSYVTIDPHLEILILMTPTPHLRKSPILIRFFLHSATSRHANFYCKSHNFPPFKIIFWSEEIALFLHQFYAYYVYLIIKIRFQKKNPFQISGLATNVHCTLINIRHRFHWLTKSEFVGLIGPGDKSRYLFYHWKRSIFYRFIQLNFIQVKDHVLVVICTWSHETE